MRRSSAGKSVRRQTCGRPACDVTGRNSFGLDTAIVGAYRTGVAMEARQ